MKVLFFDDEHWRHDTIRERSKGADIWGAFTVPEAIHLLEEEGGFDILSLDHDIGGAFLPCDNNCGCCVAKEVGHLWGLRVEEETMVKVPPRPNPPQIIIHSWNPDAARRMEGVLKDQAYPSKLVARHPFGSFFFEGPKEGGSFSKEPEEL